MDRRCIGIPSSYLCACALLIAGCGKSPWQNCDADDENDFSNGDRCPAVFPGGALVHTPAMLRLQPSIDGMPSTGRITVVGYVDSDGDTTGTSGAETWGTPADGYFVNITVEEDRDDGPGCPLGLTLAPAPTTDLCVIDTPQRLRCLLDPVGVAEIDVSTTLDVASLEQCHITSFGKESLDESSGVTTSGGTPAGDGTTVTVEYGTGEPELAFHLANDTGPCGTAMTPCTLMGGTLSEDLCADAVPPTANADTSTSRGTFYVAVEREGVAVPVREDMRLDLEVVARGADNALQIFTDSDCSAVLPSDGIVVASGQTPTFHLCTNGRAGDYEIRAKSHDGALTGTFFVSFPPVPARLSITRESDDTDGTTGGSNDALFSLNVVDTDGRFIEERLEVTTANNEVFEVESGALFPVADGSTSLTAAFLDWTGACLLDLTL